MFSQHFGNYCTFNCPTEVIDFDIIFILSLVHNIGRCFIIDSQIWTISCTNPISLDTIMMFRDTCLFHYLTTDLVLFDIRLHLLVLAIFSLNQS
jgi:hypothetical protein